MRLSTLFPIISACVLLLACATPTKIITSWTDPGYSARSFDKLVVAAIGEDIERRKIVESGIVKQLAGKGFNAVGALEVFKPGFLDGEPERGSIRKVLLENGIDGALVVSLLDQKEKTRYVPGSVSYQPTTYYSHFHGYSTTVYEQVQTPDYYSKSTEIFLECNLYEIATGSDMLLWSAQSKTSNPRSIHDIAKSYSKELISTLLDENVLVQPKESRE